MSKLTRYVPYEKLPKGNTLRFELHYDLGWHSYLSGQSTERGIWLNMRLISCAHHTSDGKPYTTETYPMFWHAQDRKRLMMKLKKSNEKKLLAMWDRIKWYSDEDFIEYCLIASWPLAHELISIEMGHVPELITVPINI